jgi:hypothetical protein
MVSVSMLPVSEGLATPWQVILAGTTLVIGLVQEPIECGQGRGDKFSGIPYQGAPLRSSGRVYRKGRWMGFLGGRVVIPGAGISEI